MKKILILLLIETMLLSACQPAATEPSPDDDSIADVTEEAVTIADSTDTPVAVEETSSGDNTSEADDLIDETKTISSALADILTQENSAGDLGAYFRANITSASPEEAEEMLQWLLVYQSDIRLKFNDKFYTEGYMDALNLSMGGTLNPSKIDAIENETIRADYQMLVDSFMTIIRYEETPSAETDWTALLSYEDAYGSSLSELIAMRAERQTAHRDSYYKMAEKVVIAENMYDVAENDFLKSQIASLHRYLVYDLLIGPEGSYMGTFVGKSDEIYEAVMAFAFDFDTSSFGQFLLELDANDWSDYRGPLDLVEHYTSFGYGSSFQWMKDSVVTDTVQQDILILVSEDHPTVADEVNEAIQGVIDDLAADTNGSYAVTMNASYDDQAYASAFVSIHYLKDDANVDYLEKAVTFDLSTGKLITFADYLNLSDQEALEVVNAIGNADFQQLPDFLVFEQGLLVSKKEGDSGETWSVVLSLKDLIPYVTPETLVR